MDYFSPEYHDPKTNIAKTPHLLGQQLPFWRFLTSFLPTEASISIFSQHLLTKILENVFHALKLPQSKYHLIWTPRSKENQFQRSLFRGRPFEISTFKYYICFTVSVCKKSKTFYKKEFERGSTDTVSLQASQQNLVKFFLLIKNSKNTEKYPLNWFVSWEDWR